MKSKNAKAYIDAHVVNVEEYKPTSRTGGLVVRLTSVIRVVELVELEAEERIRQKALKVIKEMMSGIFRGDMPQKIADEFIQKLNDN